MSVHVCVHVCVHVHVYEHVSVQLDFIELWKTVYDMVDDDGLMSNQSTVTAVSRCGALLITIAQGNVKRSVQHHRLHVHASQQPQHGQSPTDGTAVLLTSTAEVGAGVCVRACVCGCVCVSVCVCVCAQLPCSFVFCTVALGEIRPGVPIWHPQLARP